MRIRFSAVACLFVLLNVRADALEVLSYYDAEPFHFPQKNGGLVRDIVQALDEANPALGLTYRVIPRVKLNALMLSSSDSFLVPLANPLWFGDKKRQKYQWSIPLYEDYNALISPLVHPVEFHGHQSFYDKQVGVPRGYSIYMLDDLVAQNRSKRVDVADMCELVKLVGEDKLDMAVIPNVVARYKTQEAGMNGKVYFSKRPQQSYKRFFLFYGGNDAQLEQLNKAIRIIQQSGELAAILKKYGSE